MLEEKKITEKLVGQIERITFHNEENGFCVLRVNVRGQKEAVTVVGTVVNVGVGENIEAEGSWLRDKTYGMQFRAEQLHIIAPTTLDGIEKYLGSGMIKGVGPHFAKKLVKKFGEEVFSIIEKEPKRLRDVGGIGEKRIAMITAAWGEQKIIREIMVFLQSHGIGTARAVRIYKTYGENAIEKVRENPYRLARDIYGVGFKTADVLAQNLGIAKDSLIRARAGVFYSLQEMSNEGHCAAPFELLCQKAATLLEIPEKIIVDAINAELQAKNLIVEKLKGKAAESFIIAAQNTGALDADEKHSTIQAIFLASLHQAEVSVAHNLSRIKNGEIPWGKIDESKALPWVETKTGLELSKTQKQAVALALKTKVMIITGGPGVGKTTVVNSFLKIVNAKGIRICLCAPTGRAAKRLAETTGMIAKTIHRQLRYDPSARTFVFRRDNPLMTDLVVVDEASMIDINLLENLLQAIPNDAALLIIGDTDQLPSVGPGSILSDLIASNAIPVVQLTEIFRQAKDSKIITNAHRINAGEMPIYDQLSSAKTDFFIIPAENLEEIQTKILQVVTERVPKKFGFDPLRDIQVLSPMNRGGLGSKALNALLQEKLNPTSTPRIARFGWTFAPGDKVIQNINNYDKDVFNGDIGTIKEIDIEASNLIINFDDNLVEYGFNELDEISLAYAISIHKSQGSEYPVVVIPLSMQHYMMLARNLLYTGVTRGKKLVIIVGQDKAIAMAVSNAKTKQRLTNLSTRLLE